MRRIEELRYHLEQTTTAMATRRDPQPWTSKSKLPKRAVHCLCQIVRISSIMRRAPLQQKAAYHKDAETILCLKYFNKVRVGRQDRWLQSSIIPFQIKKEQTLHHQRAQKQHTWPEQTSKRSVMLAYRRNKREVETIEGTVLCRERTHWICDCLVLCLVYAGLDIGVLLTIALANLGQQFGHILMQIPVIVR